MWVHVHMCIMFGCMYVCVCIPRIHGNECHDFPLVEQRKASQNSRYICERKVTPPILISLSFMMFTVSIMLVFQSPHIKETTSKKSLSLFNFDCLHFIFVCVLSGLGFLKLFTLIKFICRNNIFG